MDSILAPLKVEKPEKPKERSIKGLIKVSDYNKEYFSSIFKKKGKRK